MDIAEIKKNEMVEIEGFCESIREYGHIFHYEPSKLDAPFAKILEGISEVNKMMKESFEM
jgi:hypothetical protein